MKSETVSVECPECACYSPDNCAWCKNAKVINPDAWVEYQPHRQRPKTFCDIELRSGKVIEGCYPNADTFTQMVEPFMGQFKDYRVVRVKLSKRQPWKE